MGKIKFDMIKMKIFIQNKSNRKISWNCFSNNLRNNRYNCAHYDAMKYIAFQHKEIIKKCLCLIRTWCVLFSMRPQTSTRKWTHMRPKRHERCTVVFIFQFFFLFVEFIKPKTNDHTEKQARERRAAVVRMDKKWRRKIKM